MKAFFLILFATVASGDEIFVRSKEAQTFRYSLPSAIVKNVAQILGSETFSDNVLNQQLHDRIQTNNSMVRLDRCLEFLHGIPARCPGTNPNKWLILTRPFELVLLDSCLPLLELSSSVIKEDPQQLIKKLITIGYLDVDTMEFLDEPTTMRMLIDRLKELERYDQLFSHAAFKDLILNRLVEAPETNSILTKPELHMELLFSLGAKLTLLTINGGRNGSNASNRSQQIYGECFYDQIVMNLSRIKLLATTSYIRLLKKSIENITLNCAQNIENLLNYEIIYGKYGNETIEAISRSNDSYLNFYGETRGNVRHTEQMYSLMDALEDIIMISSGKYQNGDTDDFDGALNYIARMNLEKRQDNEALSDHVMNFLTERARVVFYRSFNYLTTDMANYIYSHHIMMACNKIKDTTSGRIEAYDQAYKYLDSEVRSSRLMMGGESTMVANIVYQANKICNKLVTLMPLLEVTIEPLPVAVNSIFSDSPQERY